MKIIYTESFPTAENVPDAASTLRLVQKIVEDRLADEVLKRISKAGDSETA